MRDKVKNYATICPRSHTPYSDNDDVIAVVDLDAAAAAADDDGLYRAPQARSQINAN